MVAEVRAALPRGSVLCYAMKANGNPEVVATLAERTDGLEVASGGELALARRVGARLVVFGGPGKTDDELRAALAAGALVNVESRTELYRLATLATAADLLEVPIVLRVNRAEPVTVGGHGLRGSHRMAGVPTPFGIEDAALASVAADVPDPLVVVGLHLHAVSNNLDAAAHARFVADAVRWSVTTADRLGFELRYVNVGGGFGVDYTGDERFDLAELGTGLAEAASALPSGTRLIFEPGRLLAAAAGWYAAEVVDVKRTHGRWFAVLRGGTHHFRLPAAWGYSHPCTVLPVDEWRYPFDRPQASDVPVDVVGELCTPRDVLARGQWMSRVRAGDVLVFGNAGAYGLDISHHEFLRHPHPTITVV
jgi:diaminopimelate decarboxylase